MITFPRPSDDELEADRSVSMERFRFGRLHETRDRYEKEHDQAMRQVESFFAGTDDLKALVGSGIDRLPSKDDLEVLRSLAGPPISADDLKTLLGYSLDGGRVRSDPSKVGDAIDVVVGALDRRRVPWAIQGKVPTDRELHAAKLATATALAIRRTETWRRNDARGSQEARVREALEEAGMKAVPRRRIEAPRDYPHPGEFMGETAVADRNADLVARLRDERLLLIECKVSNSSVNSIKRLNNDAVVKAVHWISQLGPRHVVPVAVLSGVFELSSLQHAREKGLGIVWEHKIEALTSFVVSAS